MELYMEELYVTERIAFCPGTALFSLVYAPSRTSLFVNTTRSRHHNTTDGPSRARATVEEAQLVVWSSNQTAGAWVSPLRKLAGRLPWADA